MSDWTKAYARALGIKWTPQVDARLVQWQRWEGGSTNNSATNNFMNTKQSMPGSWDAIGNGVQGYKTLAQGAQAFAQTVRNGHYPTLTSWLATGQGDPSHDLQVWVAGPGGVGSPSAVAYAAKVLGGGGGSSASTAASTPGATPATPSFDGSTVDPMTAVRHTAAEGFAAIAQGRAKPQDTFGPLIDTIKAQKAAPAVPALPGAPQTPTVDIRGGSKLEKQAAALVQKYIGVNYQWGGTSVKTGFDCSGLVQYVWKTLGVSIPRTTYEQWDAGIPVKGNLRPGDEVFFTGSDPMNGKPGHEGMYIGGGLFIEAPGRGKVVRVSKLSGRSDYVGARRFA